MKFVRVAVMLGLASCIRMGPLGSGAGSALERDARHLAPNDLAAPGPQVATGTGIDLGRVSVALYKPESLRGRAPAIVFLPGLMAPEWQYESYARDLASRGFVVAVRGGYGPFESEVVLKNDASFIASWLISSGLADASRIGIAGHSRGAKDAVWAAADDPRFAAVVALEPDDQGAITVAKGAIKHLHAPLLLVGAEVAWRGWQICCPREHNYQRFFEHAPKGTVEITLSGADHVQLMDNPDFPGQQICRVGTADSLTVRTLARRALVDFFEQHLAGAPPTDLGLGASGSVRIKG